MNNSFTARMKALLPSLSVLCLLFLITLGRTQAAITTFTTDTSWRVTNTNFVGWNTNGYVLTPAWLVPGGGNAICGQVGVLGANKIWYPANTPYQTNYFRKKFAINQLCEVKSVTVEIACDDACTLYFNGTAIGNGTANTKIFNIPVSLLRCDNVIAVQARDLGAGCWWMAAKVTINTTPISLAATSNSPLTNPLCVGQTVNLSAGAVAGATYSWTGPSGFTSTLQNPTIPSTSLASAGTYTVVVTSGKCCQYVATVEVAIRQCSDCMDLILKEIICKNGVYYLTVCFQNNSSHVANNINLISSTPSVTYTPNILSPPGGLLPGQTFCTTVVVGGTGATTGALVCLKAMLLEIKNCKPTWFCMTKDDLCLKLPPCPTTTTPCDSVKVNFNLNSVTICLGDSVQLNPIVTPTSGLGYSWSPGTGLSNVIIKNPWAKPTITTTYTLTVYIPGTNCKKDASVTVIVKQCPPTNLCDWKAAVKDTALTICRGTSTTLSAYTIPAVVGATYNWTSSPASTIVNGSTATPTVTPLSNPTIYTVTITTGNPATGQLCIKTVTVKVYLKDCPPTQIPCDSVKVGFVPNNVTICLGDSVQLNPITNPVTGLSYTWLPPAGLSNAFIKNPWAKLTITTTYNLIVGIPGTNCKRDASITVTVKQCSPIPSGQRKAVEQEASEEIKIAPNPTQSVISVQIPDSMNWEKATLINAQGIILNEQERINEAKSVKFDVQSQPSGMYIIRVKTDKGFVSKKVIKE